MSAEFAVSRQKVGGCTASHCTRVICNSVSRTSHNTSDLVISAQVASKQSITYCSAGSFSFFAVSVSNKSPLLLSLTFLFFSLESPFCLSLSLPWNFWTFCGVLSIFHSSRASLSDLRRRRHDLSLLCSAQLSHLRSLYVTQLR